VFSLPSRDFASLSVGLSNSPANTYTTYLLQPAGQPFIQLDNKTPSTNYPTADVKWGALSFCMSTHKALVYVLIRTYRNYPLQGVKGASCCWWWKYVVC